VAEPNETNQSLANGPNTRNPPIAQRGPDRPESIGTADASLQDFGSLTYEPGFGLREKAFSLSPDPRFFFRHPSHGATFDALLAGIRRREGILVLTGEVGTGKTTLCRAVLQSLDRKTLAAFVPDPFLSREDLLKTLLIDFGVISVDDIRSGRLRDASRTDLSYTLYDFLTSLQPLQAFAIVVIDEAQNLSTQLLEEIRILSDMEHRQKLLQLLLVGQPELQSRLDTSEMRQLAQRISIRSELLPFARKDVRPYVSHRLTIAGNGTLHFTDAAIDVVYEASSGIPRVINLVCDRALFRAGRDGTMMVDAEHILGAVDDLKLPVARRLRALPWDKAETNLESFSTESVEVPAPREEPQPQPQPPGSLPTADPIAIRSDSATRATERSPFTIRRSLVWDTLGPHLESSDREWLEASAASVQRHAPSRPEIEGSSSTADPIATRPMSGPNLESFDREWQETSTARVERQLQARPEGENSLPVGDRIGHTLGDLAGSTEQSPAVTLEEDFAAPRPRRIGWPALVIALLAVTTAVVAYPYWVSVVSPQRPDVPVGVAQPFAPPQPPVPAEVASTTGKSEPGGPRNPVPGQSQLARFALQMATFQNTENTARAVQELQDAGYRAYSAGVTLPSGRPAVGVFLGPYAERAEAEQDLQRANQLPGYAGGHLVRVEPTGSVKPPS